MAYSLNGSKSDTWLQPMSISVRDTVISKLCKLLILHNKDFDKLGVRNRDNSLFSKKHERKLKSYKNSLIAYLRSLHYTNGDKPSDIIDNLIASVPTDIQLDELVSVFTMKLTKYHNEHLMIKRDNKIKYDGVVKV